MKDESHIPHIAIAGNPNCGKTTVFNALTGLRQKVANYPGVTVEKKEGVLRLDEIGEVHVIDLPGTYSLSPRSLDEEIAHDVLLGLREDTPRPQVVVALTDASNLERNLFFVSQLLTTGDPVVVALNMIDQAQEDGFTIDCEALSKRLGVPVIPMIANKGVGLKELKAAIAQQLKNPKLPHEVIHLPDAFSNRLNQVAGLMVKNGLASEEAAMGEALRLVSSEQALDHPRIAKADSELLKVVESIRSELKDEGHLWYAIEADSRYRWIESVLPEIRHHRPVPTSLSDHIDRILTHRVAGPIALILVMMLVFASIFLLAQKPMDAIEHGFGWLAFQFTQWMPAGPLQDLITQGVIAGVGSVLVFLPQILLLFFFIAAMEDSGYMARAAFIMDRIMGQVGLPGRAFIPFLSSFACAIPGIMGARVIENARDRLVTILVAPLMCCAARWPVYLLLAAAVIPNILVLGFLPLPALVIGTMVVMGVVAAMGVAGLFKRTILKGPNTSLVMELPPYRIPKFRTLLLVMLERGLLFVRKAGTIILAITIVLWAMCNYPRIPNATPDEQIENSIAGVLGRAIEPLIAPIGFDWRIGVAITSSFAAREVFVSSMGTIYGVDAADPHSTADLQDHLRKEIDPVTGRAFFTPLRAITIMIFYVLSMQCMSTLVIVRREAGNWKWPAFQWVYMTALAWVACFIVWQGGQLLGW